MLLRLLVKWVFLALIIGCAAAVIPGVHVRGGFVSLLWIAALFSIVNLVVGPVARFFSFPLIVITLGLFSLVINAGLFGLTAALSGHLDVDGFGSALLAGAAVAVLSAIVEFLLPLSRSSARSGSAS